MELFDVYPKMNLTPELGSGAYIYDKWGDRYLDLYGGHAVISIGHGHPKFIQTITDQLNKLPYYSNAVDLPIQRELAATLERVSGHDNYSLFLVNSGAEANENAIKLASFKTGKKKVVVAKRSFHGRTGGLVAMTGNPSIIAPINENHDVSWVPLNDTEALEEALDSSTAALILEGVQGIGGIYEPTGSYLKDARQLCDKLGIILILDEIQSGFGRTGSFFAFDPSGIKPDLITMAKGMGNGFPVGGVLISEKFEAKPGLLGTTFGGNPLACSAAKCVLECIEEEGLMENARLQGKHLIEALNAMQGITEIRGRGLMIGIQLEDKAKEARLKLLRKGVITGSSSEPNTIRLLPPLNLNKDQCDEFIIKFEEVLKTL